MGKATILSGGDEGLYTVEIILETGAIDAEIARLQDQKSALDNQAAGMEDGLPKSIVELKAAAIQKKIDYLSDPVNVPTNPIRSIWCADLTEDLSGDVGFVEIAGIRDNGFNIQPGYEGNAVYNQTRDGQIKPAAAVLAPETYFDWAMRGGWQKWKPTYRWGTITEIDHNADTCTVSLEEETSPDCGLSVNQSGSLSGVPIEYMSCNSAAFEVGDAVVVKFEGNAWSGAKVIGFKEEPKGCFWEDWSDELCGKHSWRTRHLSTVLCGLTEGFSLNDEDHILTMAGITEEQLYRLDHYPEWDSTTINVGTGEGDISHIKFKVAWSGSSEDVSIYLYVAFEVGSLFFDFVDDPPSEDDRHINCRGYNNVEFSYDMSTKFTGPIKRIQFNVTSADATHAGYGLLDIHYVHFY